MGWGSRRSIGALALLQGILRRAVEWRRIGHNPVKAVQKPKVRRQREVRPLSPLTVEQLRAVVARRRKHGGRDAALIGARLRGSTASGGACAALGRCTRAGAAGREGG